MHDIFEVEGTCYGLVYSETDENNALSDQCTALVLDEIIAKMQILRHANMNIVAISVTERLFNGICGNKMVLVGDTMMPKKSAMKRLYGVPLKAKEKTMHPNERQFSIEVV